MDYTQKLDWISRYRKNRLRLAVLKQKKERIASFAERTTTSYSFAPGGSGEDRVQIAIERQEEVDLEIAHIEAVMPEQKKEILFALRQVDNENHRKVLYYFYVVCLNWMDVADLTGYGTRYVKDIRSRIIHQLEL